MEFDVTMCDAWMRGDRSLVSFALANSEDETGTALRFLRYAYKKGYEELAELLAKNYDFTSRLELAYEKTPLMCACSCNQAGMVDFDARQTYHDPHAVDGRGYTASMYALPHLDLLRKLVQNGMLDQEHATLYYNYDHLTVAVLQSLFPTAKYLFEAVHFNKTDGLGRIYSDIVFANGKKAFDENENVWDATASDLTRHVLNQLDFVAEVLKVPVRVTVTQQTPFGTVAFDEAVDLCFRKSEVVMWMVERGAVELEDGSLDEEPLVRNATKLNAYFVSALEKKCALNACVRLVSKLFEKRTQKQLGFFEGLVGHFAGAGKTGDEKRRVQRVLTLLRKL